MNVLSGAPRRYRIVFRGECGDAFAGLFSDATIVSRNGHTCVVAAVRDASEFYGLLERFQDLALLPVSINEIGPGEHGRLNTATPGAVASGTAPGRAPGN